MKPSTKNSWSVFIFAYNEEGTIGKVISDTVALLQEIASDFEVVVIDDGSSDQTAAMISSAADQKPSVRSVRHPINWGIGRTLEHGYRLCQKQIVCGIPADGEFAIQCLREVPAALATTDIVCFFRTNRRGPLVRQFLTYSHRLLNRLFLGLNIRDVNWVKAYKRWVLDAVTTHSQSPLIETELLAHALRRGARIAELPSPFKMRERRGGAGLLGTLKNGFKMTVELVKFCLKFRFSRTQ
jgi:glycosyltransferase involved in cell wall biosynthesis